MDKQVWVEPKLEELDVSETLGGIFTNFSEALIGTLPGGGTAPVGQDFS